MTASDPTTEDPLVARVRAIQAKARKRDWPETEVEQQELSPEETQK